MVVSGAFNWCVYWRANEPCVGNYDVVKGLVSTPEAGETDLDNHGGDMRNLTTTIIAIGWQMLVS